MALPWVCVNPEGRSCDSLPQLLSYRPGEGRRGTIVHLIVTCSICSGVVGRRDRSPEIRAGHSIGSATDSRQRMTGRRDKAGRGAAMEPLVREKGRRRLGCGKCWRPLWEDRSGDGKAAVWHGVGGGGGLEVETKDGNGTEGGDGRRRVSGWVTRDSCMPSLILSSTIECTIPSWIQRSSSSFVSYTRRSQKVSINCQVLAGVPTGVFSWYVLFNHLSWLQFVHSDTTSKCA